MSAKQTQKPLVRIQALEERYKVLRNSIRSRHNNALFLAMAINQGEKTIVRRGFKWGGREYVPGDEFIPSEEERPRALTIADNGYIVTTAEWKANAEAQRIKPILEKTEASKRLYLNHMREKSEAGGRLAAAQAEVLAAQGNFEAAEANTKRTERELGEILDAAGAG